MQHETKEATPAALAARFFEVLLERFDMLSDVAEQYGARAGRPRVSVALVEAANLLKP